MPADIACEVCGAVRRVPNYLAGKARFCSCHCRAVAQSRAAAARPKTPRPKTPRKPETRCEVCRAEIGHAGWCESCRELTADIRAALGESGADAPDAARRAELHRRRCALFRESPDPRLFR